MNRIVTKDERKMKKGANKMEKLICFECGAKDCYEIKEMEREYEGEGYHFVLKENVPFCKKCGAPMITEELEDKLAERANRKIRECRHIIQREEMLMIVSQYDASQKFISRMLGWGEITLTRYLNSNYTPNIANSNKLKSIKDPYVFKDILEKQIEESEGAILEEVAFVKLITSVNKQIENVENKNGKIYKVVNWFLSQASEENRLTHLTLQKLLYFSQAWNYILNKEWLFQDDCEVLVHGAVYYKVYNDFKKFKYRPLPIVEVETELSEQEIEVLRAVKEYYFDIYTAKTLEKICHLEEPFKNARRGCCDEERSVEIIDKQSIQDYYTKIATMYNVSKDNLDNIGVYLNEMLSGKNLI